MMENRKIPFFLRKDLDNYLIHEFSHGIINDLTDKYSEIYKDIEFDDIMEKMKSLAYGTKKTIINEHIIRAIECVYVNKYYGDNAKNKIKEWEKEMGFKYIESCINSIEEYMNNLDKYKTFEEFFPTILTSLTKSRIQEKDKTLNS